MIKEFIKHIESFDQIKASVKYYDGDDKRWAIRLSMCVENNHESVIFLREPYKEGNPYYIVVGCGKRADRCSDYYVSEWIRGFLLQGFQFDGQVVVDVLRRSYLQGRPEEPKTHHLINEANEILSTLQHGYNSGT